MSQKNKELILQNNDKIILITSDNQYLALKNDKLYLSRIAKDAVVCLINANEGVLGFKFQIEIDSNIYFINADTQNKQISITIGSSATGTNWCYAPTLIDSECLFIALTQNGSARFLNGSPSGELSLVDYPSLTKRTSNPSAWTFKSAIVK